MFHACKVVATVSNRTIPLSGDIIIFIAGEQKMAISFRLTWIGVTSHCLCSTGVVLIKHNYLAWKPDSERKKMW